MRKVSLQKQIKDSMQPGTVACYKTPEGTFLKAYVPDQEELNNRIAIAKKMGQKPKEVTEGGKITQKLLKDLIDNEEFLYMCLDIEYMQKQHKYSIASCMDILYTKHKKELPLGVNYTFNSIYLSNDWYYYNKSLLQYISVLDLLPVKYRKKWLK